MKVGIMSFAHPHGASYATRLGGRAGVEVRAADDDAERGKRVADRAGVGYVGSHADLLDWGPDAVLVCAENSRHRELTELAAAAGAHVLTEKPLATSLADGRAMIDACERAGVGLMTAFPMRFSLPVGALVAAVRDGQLGRVYGAAGTNPGRLPSRTSPWFCDPELAGGGSVMDHTVHVADLLRWMLGAKAASVYAQTTRLLYPDVAVETGGTVAVTFDDGTVATIDCSWSRPVSYPTWGGVTLQVVGEAGVAEVDAGAQVISSYHDGPSRSGPPEVAWTRWGADPDAAMLGEFLAACREGRPPRPDGWDGYRATEIALAAYRSARTGQPVDLPLD